MCRHSDPVADSVWLLLKRPIPLQKEEMRGKRAARPPCPTTFELKCGKRCAVKKKVTDICEAVFESQNNTKCVLSGAKGSYDSEVMCRFGPRWHLMFAEQCWKKGKQNESGEGSWKYRSIYIYWEKVFSYICLGIHRMIKKCPRDDWKSPDFFFFWSLENPIQLL